MFKKLYRLLAPNPFDRLLKRAVRENKKSFLILWNRGLGDIPLGLYALIHRIRHFIPHASITFFTRADLAPLFEMLDNVKVLIGEEMKRGQPFSLEEGLKKHSLAPNMFDVVIEKADPTYWLKWQIGKLTPKLDWKKKWDLLAEQYGLDKEKTYIGAHVQTETGSHYKYEKNWDLPYWRDLFKKIGEEKKGTILLFGLKDDLPFLMDHVIDLRGKTDLFQMLSIIKNHCRYLIVPDSGVLSVAYYIDAKFPLRVVSLWADPRQGVLRQKVASPNSGLEHFPLIGKDEKVSNITPQEAYEALFSL